MLTRFYFPAFALLALALGWSACGESLPEEEVVYLFKYKTRVDAHRLRCGYHEQEKCSDELKRTIRRRVGPLSVAAQKRLGERMHQELVHLILDDAEYNARVEAIVERMKPFLSKKDFDHNVYVLEDEEFLAFTMPGGNIYVSTGLLMTLPTDDELAFIIGHELGHSENNHTHELAQLIKYIELLENEGGFSNMLDAMWTQLSAAACNQADELECDVAAVYLLHAAGYNPERAFDVTRVLREMDDEKPDDEIERWIMSLMRTHPWSEDRDRCVRDYVKNARTVVKCRQTYKKGRGKVQTKRLPLNVRRHPNPESETLGQFQRNEEIVLICDCVKQQNGMQFVYARNNDGLKGWVDKKYVQVLSK
jgi:predicted Zn-dependent protease